MGRFEMGRAMGRFEMGRAMGKGFCPLSICLT